MMDSEKLGGGAGTATSTVGFALVTHNQPEQVAALCWKLSSMFDFPPIAIHHDYSQCAFDLATLPPQVVFVSDWVETSWGTSSLVEAYLSALRLLHSKASPCWTVSLSGADYPIKTAEYIIRDLSDAKADAFLDFREVRKPRGDWVPNKKLSSNYERREWLTEAWGRYVGFSIVHYRLRKLFGREDRPVYVSNSVLRRLFTPFSSSFRPYAGDAWHTLNRRAVALLLGETPKILELKRYYNRRIVPDESFYHTVLLNAGDLSIQNDNRRFSIWNGAAHPKMLGFRDIPAMMASGGHFARKFSFEPALFRAIDAAVEAESSKSR